MIINASAQVTTNSSSGLAATYSSLAAAITALNAATINAPVTISLTASNPQTAPAGGYSITATGTVTNTITITGNSNTITAPAQTSGSLNDAIFKIIGGDFITIQGFTMQENAANTTTTAASNNMTEFGVALFYATTTNGAQNCTIQNNTITLNRTYQNTFGIYSNSSHSPTAVTTTGTGLAGGGNSGLKIYGNSISSVNMGIIVIGPLAAANYNTGIDIGGTASGTGNTITNFGTTGVFSGYFSVSSTLNGILVRNSTGFNVSYNSITSSNGGISTVASILRGIFIPAATVAPTGTFTNTINNNTIALTHGFTSGTIQGITVEATTGTATSTQNINNNNFTALRSSVTTSGAITAISNVMPNLANNFNGNTFTNITSNTSGSFTFFGHSYTMPASGSQTLNNNSIVTAFSKTVAGGTVTISTSGSSSPNGTFHTFTNNNFSNITVTGGTSLVGVTNSDGSATSATRTVTGNTFNNWTGGTSAITGLNYGYIGGTTSSISNNTLTNITGQSTITGITIGSSANLATTLNVSSNTINNLSSTGTGGQVLGISCSNTSTTININSNAINTLSSTAASSAVGAILVSAATTTNIYSNTIYGIASSGITSPLVLGISVQGGTTVNTYLNKIYGLSASGAISTASPAIIGINVTAGTTVNTYNNILGGFTAPAASLTDAIRGISIASTTATSNQKVYYNTINLNATSSGANFGSTGLYHTYNATGTTSALDMRNNIIVNASSAAGTGLAVAFRRSAATDLLNYATSSNNNLFFGTSGVYNDGTSTYNFADFQSLVSPRETASINQNPSFASTTGADANFLNFANGAYNLAGGNAQVLASPYNTDYAGVTRDGSLPDIGAFEFTQGIVTTWNGTTWSNGAPTSTLDAIIASSTAPASFTCKNLTINSNSALTTTDITATVHGNIINNGNGIVSTGNGLLNIAANSIFSGNAISFNGTLTLNGTSAQTLNANSATVQNFIINNAAGVTLTGALNLTGVLTPTAGILTTGGFLTLKSFANNSASIASNVSGSNYISGNVTVERFISGQSNKGRWRFLSTPVSNATVANWMSYFFVTGPGDSVLANSVNGSTLGTLNTNGWHTNLANISYPSSTMATHPISVKTTSIRTYNEAIITGNINSGWENVTSSAQALTPGKGYRAFIRGDKNAPNAANTQLGTGANSNIQGSVNLTLNGTVNQGEINANPTFSSSGTIGNDGWNLLGNPYPSSYDLFAHINAPSNSAFFANISPTVYVYSAISNGYVSYNTAGSGTNGGLDNGIVPSGAAFFIKATAVNPVFKFQEAYKTTNSHLTGGVHKTDTKTEEFGIKYYKDSTENDYVVIKMYAGATLNSDIYDIVKVRNENLNLAAYGADSVNLTASVIPPVVEETIIKLNVEATQIGTYHFDFTNIDNFEKDITVNLYDRFTNKTIDIRKNTKYTFDMGAGVNQWGNNRFELILIKTTTGIEDLVQKIANTKLLVYPNPATDELNININNANFKNSEVVVYNISGAEVLKTNMASSNAQINIETLSNGIYFVKVTNQNGFNKTVKFVK